jgi:hypothetical protein
MIKPLTITKNDFQPYYYFKAQDSTGAVIDLTGATIYCTMKHSSGTVKINRQTAGIVITNASAGEGEYHWQPGDTDMTGSYYIEIEINPLSGGKFTLPENEKAQIVVKDSLDTQ